MLNSSLAQSSLVQLKNRAAIFLLLAIVAVLVGVILIAANLGDALAPASLYSSNEGAVAGLGWGIIFTSLGSTLLTGWFFAVSIANHAEVVYYSSSASAPSPSRPQTVAPSAQPAAVARPEENQPREAASSQPQEPEHRRCADCGARNLVSATYCHVCASELG
jgi:hypothetical protein